MSIDILRELQLEVRRLFIAGSRLALGDLRLSKLHPVVAKLGETSPAFARVAQALEQAMDPNQEQSEVKLLELSALLNSILHTQGKTDVEGVAVPIEGARSFQGQQYAYRKIKPVIEALTEKGQGRLEVIRQAHEEGVTRDFRLMIPAVDALDDSYSEIPELLFSRVIPEYGPDALPVLLQRFTLEGGKGDSRRLQLIDRLQGSSGKELLLQAAAEGSVEIKTTAIELLGNYADQESFLLSQADDKRKEIRRSALQALSRQGTSLASDRIYKALVSKDRELAIDPIRRIGEGDLIVRVTEFAREVGDRVVSEGGKNEETLAQLQAALDALEGRQTKEVFAMLRDLLSNSAFIVSETATLQETAASLLVSNLSAESRQFAISLAERHKGKFLKYSLHAAMQSLSPEEVYERFSVYCSEGKKRDAKELVYYLTHALPTVYDGMTDDRPLADTGEETRMDPRWLERFIRMDEAELVCRLANKPDRNTVQYLVSKCTSKPDFGSEEVIHALLALFRIGYKEAPDTLMNVLAGKNRTIYYLRSEQALLLRLLPSSYADGVALYAEKLHYPSVREQVLEIVEYLKTKPDEKSEEGKGLLQWIKQRVF